MQLEIVFIILGVLLAITSVFNAAILIMLQRQREQELSVVEQKMKLISKEQSVLEKRLKLQSDQIASMATSIVSFEKVLSALLASYGGGFGPDDGNIH